MDKLPGTLRVGAVSFVNAKPLVRYLDPVAPPPTDIILEVPSRLTEMMQDNVLDAALLPSIEYFRAGRYRIVPGISICADGAVESVRIFSKTPIEDIRLLAMDESSRTSVALAKIVLKRKLGALPEIAICSPDADFEALQTDAILLIGDPAMAFCPDNTTAVLDLGEEWKKLTGLPFVYAMWVVREGIGAELLQSKLLRARERGLAQLPQIALEASGETGLPSDLCLKYLKNTMRYELGRREIEALKLFQNLAAEDGLCPGGVDIAFTD